MGNHPWHCSSVMSIPEPGATSLRELDISACLLKRIQNKGGTPKSAWGYSIILPIEWGWMRYMVSIDWSTIPYQVLAFVFPSVDGPILALTVTTKIGASTDGTWTFLGWIEHRFLACVWWKWHSSPPFPLYGNSEVLLVQAVCEIWQKWQVAEAELKLSLWWVSYGHSSEWDCSFCNWGLKPVITCKKNML